METALTISVSVVSLEMRYNTFWSSFVFLTCHFLLFYINFLTCISFFIAAFSIGKIVFFVKITSAVE